MNSRSAKAAGVHCWPYTLPFKDQHVTGDMFWPQNNNYYGRFGELDVSAVKENSGVPLSTPKDIPAPGFLIRRLHQIHLSFFYEEAGNIGVTPVQMGVLSAIIKSPGRDQSSIAEEIGTDRATLAAVLIRLEANGLVRRTICKRDQRQKLLYPTAKGQRLVGRLQAPLRRANERTLAPLSPAERTLFLKFLSNLIDGGNEHARTKLRIFKGEV